MAQAGILTFIGVTAAPDAVGSGKVSRIVFVQQQSQLALKTALFHCKQAEALANAATKSTNEF